jgi:hypothetical protein
MSNEQLFTANTVCHPLLITHYYFTSSACGKKCGSGNGTKFFAEKERKTAKEAMAA